MIVACGNNQCESCTNKCASTSVASNKNEEGVEKAVRNAYEYYFFLLNEEEKANKAEIAGEDYIKTVEESDYDMSVYLTRKFNSTLEQTKRKQWAEDDLFLEYDYWINAQDFTAIDKFDVEITECKDNNAKANVKFKNLGEMTTITLRLEYDEEIGNWLIADFIDNEGKASLLENMIEFLSK